MHCSRPQDFDKICLAMQVTPLPIKPTKYSVEPEIYKKKSTKLKIKQENKTQIFTLYSDLGSLDRVVMNSRNCTIIQRTLL